MRCETSPEKRQLEGHPGHILRHDLVCGGELAQISLHRYTNTLQRRRRSLRSIFLQGNTELDQHFEMVDMPLKVDIYKFYMQGQPLKCTKTRLAKSEISLSGRNCTGDKVKDNDLRIAVLRGRHIHPPSANR